MASGSEEPVPPKALPTDAVDVLDALDERQLQAAVHYAQRRLQHSHQVVTDQIEAQADEEIVRIEERDGYTEVAKRESHGEDRENSSHLSLYHVTEEKRLDGSTKLHWKYLGRIAE